MESAVVHCLCYLGRREAAVKMLARDQLSPGGDTTEGACFQCHLGCWQNSLPDGCGTEVFGSLLAVGRRLLGADNVDCLKMSAYSTKSTRRISLSDPKIDILRSVTKSLVSCSIG